MSTRLNPDAAPSRPLLAIDGIGLPERSKAYPSRSRWGFPALVERVDSITARITLTTGGLSYELSQELFAVLYEVD